MGSDEHRDVEVLPSGQPQNSKNKSEFVSLGRAHSGPLTTFITLIFENKPLEARNHAFVRSDGSIDSRNG